MQNVFRSYLLVLSFFTLSSQAYAEQEDFKQIVDDVTVTMEQYHYNPAELEQPAYQEMVRQMYALAEAASTREELQRSFNILWRQGPFSHVRIDARRQSAEELAAYLDQLDVGGTGAILTWEDEIAVLTVTTMMGQDTIRQIDEAYQEIASRGAGNLIIDLRQNGGGAFAVNPLVSHLIQEPYDVGAFISQGWNAKHELPPTRKDVAGVEAWTGWSIRSFWNDAQTLDITRIQFQPTAPTFGGTVYVLIGGDTGSAAELAADALAGLDNVVLIGEQTSGTMLSQKIYDIAGDMQLSLPIADYYAWTSGRIEGKGVQPKIQLPAGDAMDKALSLARQR